MSKIRDLIHPEGLEMGLSTGPTDDQGWAGGANVVKRLAKGAMVFVEVGVWKGATTMRVAPTLPEGAEYIAVDTWLGSTEFWTRPDKQRNLAKYRGFPTIYDTFLDNIINSGLQEIVTPFPTDSKTASECFREWGVEADVVFLDAGHSYENAFSDIVAWWPSVRPGGILCGDDWSEWWPGVSKAVKTFCGGNYKVEGKVWWTRKDPPRE